MAQAVAKAIGIEPHVYPYFDNDRSHQLDILSLTDPADRDVGIYFSIGLSDYENQVKIEGGQENIPVELFLTAYKRFDKAPNILSTAAFYILKDRYECRPASVFKHLVSPYYKDSELKHIYFTEPFLWQDKLAGLDGSVKKVACLLLVPISDAELDYKVRYGDEALEKLLQDKEIDMYDLARPSIV